MWFNSMIREEPYLGMKCIGWQLETDAVHFGDLYVGAAWLSSARAVGCRVKSHNERNPCRQLPARQGGDSGGTAGASREEGGDDVKSA